MDGHSLSVEGLTKTFAGTDDATPAVNDVTFRVERDQFVTLLGPSGCGKTTTLRMIAGLEPPDAGRVLLDGRDFLALSPTQRGIGMVFQSYALFPHLTVFENAAYGLRLRTSDSNEVRRKTDAILKTLGLGSFASRYPADLSGGQQQRVAIARALVYDPALLLLDEPLANLDAKLRLQMREEIRRLQKSMGVMTLYVTHDQEEALAVSDRIAVFDRGRLMQFGAPADIYSAPRSMFVADFVGAANFFKTIGPLDGGRNVTIAGLGNVHPARAVIAPTVEQGNLPDGGIVLVRPEHLRLEPAGDGLPCRVMRAQFLGSLVRYSVVCDAADAEVIVEATRPVNGISEGSPGRLSFNAADALLFTRDSAW